MAAIDRNSILLGAGELFGVAFTGAIPTDAVLETPANTFGRTKGGAELVYTPEEHAVVDDKGETVQRFLVKEEATLKCGVLTWAMQNLARLSPATLTDDEVTKTRTIRLGGASQLEHYVLRFVHTKPDGTKLRVTMIGTAGAGFTLTFSGSEETVIDAEFKALAQTDGTIVTIAEEYL